MSTTEKNLVKALELSQKQVKMLLNMVSAPTKRKRGGRQPWKWTLEPSESRERPEKSQYHKTHPKKWELDSAESRERVKSG